MAIDQKYDPDLEWLNLVAPVGLVVAPSLIKELGLVPPRQTQSDSFAVLELLQEDLSQPALTNPWAFVNSILGWENRHVAGSPGGPELPNELSVSLPEHNTTLQPTWAVKELGNRDQRWQLLVRIESPGVDPDARGELNGWEATPHQRFERLLRDTGVFAGLLFTDKVLRLIYAPRGETSGYMNFPLRDFGTVAGRPILGGLKLLLDSFRLFNDADNRRLPALLEKSREAQASVSTALAEQVLGALHELLRGLDAADPALVRNLADTKPDHLYEGLLTVLMRLVFTLYAEDRDLLPSRKDVRACSIYETSYSVRGLYAKLVEDAALNPDTMDERRGGWGRLIAVFRLIYSGHPSGFIRARGGKLFNPDEFLFLEGRKDASDAPRILTVSDGCLLRVLEGLMTLKMRGGTRERLSYRTLDVEQIGSVYETVMGFTVEKTRGHVLAIKAGKNNKTPVFVNLDDLIAKKGVDRIKLIKESAGRQLTDAQAKPVKAASSIADLIAAFSSIIDPRGSPNFSPSPMGTPVLQPTDERRQTGSHYTPRSLTGPIVRHALEPAFERLGEDATPEQILELKVCDPAMGSGAFLVEACRAIGERLVTAWEKHKDKRPVIPTDEDEDLHARRLVAQRCLYGVDKNPRAVDLARLSLWLATLAHDHEFTFLDHALKCGDSLVGLTQAQISALNWDVSKAGLPLFRQLVLDKVAKVTQGRAEIQTAPDDTKRVIQEARLRNLELEVSPIRLVGNAVISAFFAADRARAREKARADVESYISGMPPRWDLLESAATRLRAGEHGITPFHWLVEFPEVFIRENGGFDAIIGNPPFIRGKAIGTVIGEPYRDWLKENYPLSNSSADLASFFFRRSFELLRGDGTLSLIATKTISQGATRRSGLRYICKNGGNIYHVKRRMRWPGDASVSVSVVHITKGQWNRERILDGKTVQEITAFFFQHGGHDDPKKLRANANISFNGCAIAGVGFTFDDSEPRAGSVAEMRSLIEKDPNNSERIFPFIGGEEINGSPTHVTSRYIIFFNGMELSETNRWPDLQSIVRERVKPEREKANRKAHRDRWWQFGDWRPGLFQAISGQHRMLCVVFISQYLGFSWIPTNHIVSHNVGVFATESDGFFGVVQSRVHEYFATQLSSGLEERPGYRPSDGFEPFPFPANLNNNEKLALIGRSYYAFRSEIMVGRDEGLTEIYARFHNRFDQSPDIERLRALHTQMDAVVLRAYGWNDLADLAAPEFIEQDADEGKTPKTRFDWPSEFKDEVLARLLALNAERAAAERAAGLTVAANEDEDTMDEEEGIE